jgi:hypothetical protein
LSIWSKGRVYDLRTDSAITYAVDPTATRFDDTVWHAKFTEKTEVSVVLNWLNQHGRVVQRISDARLRIGTPHWVDILRSILPTQGGFWLGYAGELQPGELWGRAARLFNGQNGILLPGPY